MACASVEETAIQRHWLCKFGKSILIWGTGKANALKEWAGTQKTVWIWNGQGTCIWGSDIIGDLIM